MSARESGPKARVPRPLVQIARILTTVGDHAAAWSQLPADERHQLEVVVALLREPIAGELAAAELAEARRTLRRCAALLSRLGGTTSSTRGLLRAADLLEGRDGAAR